MTAAFTVILPHKRNPGNNAALAIALSCLQDNTASDFKLIMDAATDAPLYERINRMVEQADTDICVYMASDIFVAPAWDIPMLAIYEQRFFVTNIIVEPGAIAMHGMNIHKDFGRKPETFNRAAFEAWTQGDAQTLDVRGEGWPCSYMFSRDAWLAHGGLETNLYSPDGFTEADTNLWNRWKAAGNEIVRAQSYCYHLQRFSDEYEQTKVGR